MACRFNVFTDSFIMSQTSDALRPHVLLVTTTNLASNPRCLKEMQVLLSMNFKISLVCFQYNNWTTEKERLLHQEYSQVAFYYLDATKRNFGAWLFTSLLEKTARMLSPAFPQNKLLTSIAVSKRSWRLLGWMKKWKGSPDFVIGHNPGAFYPANYIANKFKIPFAIDVEDYHPGEMDNFTLQTHMVRLLKNHLPKCMYVSFASPLIKKYTLGLLEMNHQNAITVNNVFSREEFAVPGSFEESSKLRFVWFSQYADYTRGIEKFLQALDKYHNKVEVTLIGECRKEFYDNEIKGRDYIIHKTPLSQKQLHILLASYDIGLAVEDKTCDLNKDICLTNKLWAYFQAGLYIVASDTQGQQLFMEKNKDHGLCISLQNILTEDYVGDLLEQKNSIRSNMVNRYQNAQRYGWETESGKLIQQWQFLLNRN